MLYKIAHLLRDHCGWIWELAESLNSFAFGMRYASRLKQVPEVLRRNGTEVLSLREAGVEVAEALARFFARQPEGDFEFFKPHGFDVKTLRTLLKRTSFLMYVVEQEGEIVGYFFLRSFVHGQSYLGKMVDHAHQGRGIGKLMCKTAMEVATTLGLRMFESINKRNPASMRSSSVLRQVVVKELEDGDLLIEDLPLENS